MGAMASQITSLTIVYSIVYSGADRRKHQSSASLAFVRGIHRSPVNSPRKCPVTRKMFPFDDVIMTLPESTTNRWYRVKTVCARGIHMNRRLSAEKVPLALEISFIYNSKVIDFGVYYHYDYCSEECCYHQECHHNHSCDHCQYYRHYTHYHFHLYHHT